MHRFSAEFQINSNCAATLRNACARAHLRAAKTVRASMPSMEPLLRADDAFRVIHLVRDPRAVVASRLATKDESIIGIYALKAKNDAANETRAVREAATYCRRAAADLEYSRMLQDRYPGRIMTIRYEDVVANLGSHAEAAYRFIGFDSVPRETREWIKLDQRTTVSTLDKWKQVINEEQNNIIVDGVCKHFFSLVNSIANNSDGSHVKYS
jgi:hypothetical protein